MKNISKIISIIFLIFSIFLLCYVFYRSQVIHAGILFGYYAKYYIIAFFSIFLSIVSFFIPKQLKFSITVIFVSILIVVYAIEGYFFINTNLIKKQNKQQRIKIYEDDTGKNYDKRTKFQIYHDLKKEDPNIVLRIHPSTFIPDRDLDYFPLSGLSNRKTIQCNENGYYSIYQSDRYGFNTPNDEWDKNEVEFLLVGDSFTNGSCVNEPDTFSGNLRKLNNNETSILNLGQSGSGPLIQHATLKEYLPSKRVKRVLWMYYEGNDVEDIIGELKNKILVNYLKDKNFSQKLILRKSEQEKILLNKLEKKENQEKLKQERINAYNIKRFLKLKNIRSFSIEMFFPYFPSQKEFKNILKLSDEFVKLKGSKLYFVYLPQYLRYIGKNNHDNLSNYKKIIEMVESLEIPIIDLNKELFAKHKDPLSLFAFRMGSHYNELGYKLAAQTIFEKINVLENN